MALQSIKTAQFINSLKCCVQFILLVFHFVFQLLRKFNFMTRKQDMNSIAVIIMYFPLTFDITLAV